MNTEEFNNLVKTLPHRKAMALPGVNVHIPRMLSKSLAEIKPDISGLEALVATGDTGPDVIATSTGFALKIIDAYYSPEEASRVKEAFMDQSNGSGNNETTNPDPEPDNQDNTIPFPNNNIPPPPPNTDQEPSQQIPQDPPPAPGLTKDQKVKAILTMVDQNGGISIEELLGFGVTVFADTEAINLDNKAVLVRDKNNETRFLLEKKKSYLGEILLVLFGGAVAGVGIVSAIRKK